jgi:hypothetical protein
LLYGSEHWTIKSEEIKRLRQAEGCSRLGYVRMKISGKKRNYNQYKIKQINTKFDKSFGQMTNEIDSTEQTIRTLRLRKTMEKWNENGQSKQASVSVPRSEKEQEFLGRTNSTTFPT